MFTDCQQALGFEGLPLHPTSTVTLPEGARGSGISGRAQPRPWQLAPAGHGPADRPAHPAPTASVICTRRDGHRITCAMNREVTT